MAGQMATAGTAVWWNETELLSQPPGTAGDGGKTKPWMTHTGLRMLLYCAGKQRDLQWSRL